MTDTMLDVIIIGSGPVGLTLANELALHGVKALSLETHADVSGHPKAGTYHARAVSGLARRGIFTFPRRTNSSLDITTEPFQFAGYPWLSLTTATINGPVMMGMAQEDLEKILEKTARNAGAQIVRGVTVLDVEQMQDRVTVTVQGSSGEQHTIDARYVVGADGARSIVRNSGNFTSQEFPPAMHAVLGLAQLIDPGQLQPGWQRTDRGWTLFNHNPYGDSRIIVFEFD